VPIAAHAVVNHAALRLEALVAGMDGAHVIRDSVEDEARHAARAGETLAARLRERGAEALLEGLT
jgi:porphobilinogen deaminase